MRTVQGVFEAALSELGWRESSIRAAGRTDRGVHARGQVVSFSLPWSREPDRLTAALNAHLPEDVAVRHTEIVPAEFQPRFGALRRRYVYRLLLDPAPDPLKERTAWRVWPAPDIDRMRTVADLFIGKRDFGAFGKAPIPGGHTVRAVGRADWQRGGSDLCLILEADAFLYRMVRRIVGANLQVGWGEKEPEDIERSLSDPTQRWVGRLAPAKGLCLEAVYYEA
ncbi:MAG: tRNA pseudouridine(38-40) synthase TruA [Anaerolineae bacterium]|nr:MAG: tRNA pseudouridine(38-40) synthase TruA [Anaerolineae bacterium]